jgi:hypothetical protein
MQMKNMIAPTWTPQSHVPSTYPSKLRTLSDRWSAIGAEQLQVVREPIHQKLRFGMGADARALNHLIRNAATGPYDDMWETPTWLLPHQINAARRICASIEYFRGALLADAVGLGKTYVALAVASRYQSTLVVVPAAILSQWNRTSERVGVHVSTVTHEALSRMAGVPQADLIVVDEAHRFRNPNTRRYERLASGVRDAKMLLLTASPVVNRPSDLVHLLRLFCADSAFSLFGMASIEESISNGDYALLIRAVAPAVVARSPESIDDLMDELPRLRDGNVCRAGSVDQHMLTALLRVIDTLRFPSSAESRECDLLRLHLLHRLASSKAAFTQTVRRHLAYTDRAIDAVSRGESLSRSLARQIFNNELDLQLALGDVTEPSLNREIDLDGLEADRQRFRRLLELSSAANGTSPKSRRLGLILQRRAGRKTVVFATAIATALDLARSLEWKETAVVGGGHGWIASGRISVDEVLSLFAPNAYGRPKPPRSMQLSTLVATDLVSEGLNLQDADAVVHYDLPWTPLKLEQRVGRIARLGSVFRTADVFWFAPPEELDRRLRMECRIARKACDQIGLHVPATSKLGQARIVNHELQERERLGRSNRTPTCNGPCFSVVKGPLCAVVALVWHSSGATAIPDLIALSGNPIRQLSSFEAVEHTFTDLLAAPTSQRPPPEELVELLSRILRKRLSSADRGSISQASKRLARSVLKRAYEAGKRREMRLLTTLDGVLDRLRQGLNVGSERTLTGLLSRRSTTEELESWLKEQAPTTGRHPTFEITAALFGDGSNVIA